METTDYKGYMITIDQDINESDPPYEWTTPEDRGATFALEHKRYSLPFELDNKYDEEGNNLVDLSLYNSWKEFAEACAP